MPRYTLTADWSEAIPVAPGDYVQNQSGDFVELCAVQPASSNDAIKVPSFQAVPITVATSIRARLPGRPWSNWPAEIVVIKGL